MTKEKTTNKSLLDKGYIWQVNQEKEDGKVVNIDETFEVENINGGVDNMLYPLDPNGSAGNVCNCRCTVAPVVF